MIPTLPQYAGRSNRASQRGASRSSVIHSRRSVSRSPKVSSCSQNIVSHNRRSERVAGPRSGDLPTPPVLLLSYGMLHSRWCTAVAFFTPIGYTRRSSRRGDEAQVAATQTKFGRKWQVSGQRQCHETPRLRHVNPLESSHEPANPMDRSYRHSSSSWTRTKV